MTCKTVYENDNFDLYRDKNGKFWLWDKIDETNAAIRASSELEAYRTAVDSLIFRATMLKESRDEYCNKLEDIHSCFDKVFGGGDPDEFF